jgi:ribosome recycling factor
VKNLGFRIKNEENMNLYVTAAVKELKEKLNAYLSLLSYRYANLCVKAELGALLPVTVVAEREYNLEDVAKVATPDDFRFEIYPDLPDHLQAIIAAVLDVHPEFKMELVKEDYGNRNQHIVYTMPEVDKDRRKLLNDTAKVFYEECKVEIDTACGGYLAEVPSLEGKLSVEDVTEVTRVLKRSREESLQTCQDLYQKKLAEIDEAYQRYQASHADGGQSNGIDVTSSMRLSGE